MRQILLLGLAVAVYCQFPSDDPEPRQDPPPPTSWSALLGADYEAFPSHQNTLPLTVGSDLQSNSLILHQLQTMLDTPGTLSELYSKYLQSFNKGSRRFDYVFKKNLMLIAKQNLKFHQGLSSWEEGINMFTDMPSSEFKQYYGGLPTNFLELGNFTTVPPPRDIQLGQAPDSWDWRDKKVVTPVKNQGSCGSCWAFSVIAVVESGVAIKSNGDQKPVLSEQQLVDCMKTNCQGEFPSVALDYIKENGVATNKDYPYTSGNGKTGTCKSKTAAARISNYIHTNKESEMKELCHEHGVFSAALYFHGDMGRQKSGVYDGKCGGDENGEPGGHHAVAIVGYGTEKKKDFWIIKNSWGNRFADKGYFKIARGKDKCGLESYLGSLFVPISEIN